MLSKKILEIIALCEKSRKEFLRKYIEKIAVTLELVIDFPDPNKLQALDNNLLACILIETFNDSESTSIEKFVEYSHIKEVNLVIKFQRLWLSELNRKVRELKSCSQADETKYIGNFINFLESLKNYPLEISDALMDLAKTIKGIWIIKNDESAAIHAEAENNSLDIAEKEKNKLQNAGLQSTECYKKNDSAGVTDEKANLEPTKGLIKSQACSNLSKILNQKKPPTIFKQGQAQSVENKETITHVFNPVFGMNGLSTSKK